MDKDRITGSAKEVAGKVEGAAGDMMGNGQTHAAGRAREAAGSVQNLYGQAKDAARDAGAEEIRATSLESDAMSRDLKKRGFSFVGPTICYSFMQAVGMVNDHLTTCFRHPDCVKLAKHK